MSSSQHSTLDSLLSLIASSVELIKAEYAQGGHTIPSLDSTESHPLDSDIPSLKLKSGVKTLEGACAQLAAIVASPSHTVINRAMGIYELACLRVVTETKVPDYLASGGPTGLSISEISTKTGIEEGKLGRILRLLATKHIFREISKDVFVNNRLSILLASSNELSSLTIVLTGECTKAGAELFETLTDPKYANSYAPDKAALTRAYNLEEGKTLFDWYSDNPKYGERFGRGMIGWAKGTCSGALSTVYPWSALPSSSVVTDVGGGIGHISMELARTFPQLKFVIQDLAPTVAQAKELWGQEYPEAIEQHRVEFIPVDFLVGPPVLGSDVYYLRHIIHNWPDKECIQILQNVRKAMKSGSKVLLHEYIMQHVNRVSDEEAALPQAPGPLLPNYGIGQLRQYNLDLDMMSMLNSKERTLDEFATLGEHAGLKLVKYFDTGETGIIEFHLA